MQPAKLNVPCKQCSNEMARAKWFAVANIPAALAFTAGAVCEVMTSRTAVAPGTSTGLGWGLLAAMVLARAAEGRRDDE
jgi:hypothetical protein